MRYQVEHYTFCDGWVNCWSRDDQPSTFPTLQEARNELAQYYKDIREAIRDGDMEMGPDSAEYRIQEVQSIEKGVN